MQLNILFSEFEKFTSPPVFNRVQSEQGKMILLLNKIKIIRDTDFLQPAYALLEIFLIGAVIALMLIGSEDFSESLVISCFLFTSFYYLLVLIRDLDNPFEYDGKSSVDIDLSLLETLGNRLEKNITPPYNCWLAVYKGVKARGIV